MTTSSPPRGRGTVAIVAGTVTALAGFVLAAGGALLLGVFGSDGTVASGEHSLSSSRTALVSSVADVGDISDLAEVVGDPRIEVSAAATGSKLFVGIGPAAQVDRYLAGASIDEVTDFEVDPFELSRRPREGSARPASPAAQGFWVAQATGSNAALRWKVRDGDYRLVLMNADGSRPVDAEGEVKLSLPRVAGIAWTLTGTGLLLVLVGGAVATLRRRHR